MFISEFNQNQKMYLDLIYSNKCFGMNKKVDKRKVIVNEKVS